ncbi:MAG: transcription elongation factor GreA [Clostridia bacterium]|nr:transcription elongation factor GreA [Clostridia bacterium]
MAAEQKYTLEGFQKLKDEYEYLTKTRREEVKNAIAEARSFGDLSENSEYDEARNEQAKVEARIKELDELIQHAIVIDESQIDMGIVGLGSLVKLEKNGQVVEYSIVGSNEANPFENKISDLSDIGKALSGKKAGDAFEVKVKAGSVKIKILEVSRAK